ncbi:unnamed protein product [Spirodela intermedia]|uniref:phosphatidate phosphatase n=1 Tax=Spirodela intermedia TaxID=51605 RepID=A0A7I8IGE5_SPIIN|nr:unnamed protein product [Spirodela intermedia]CAA6656851.1 unnamed protein product [Spirodela intermedia]
MNVVSKVGSLITQGVYSVATPFHPFGGAVDIIVVEQEDGTYRSTPWYVRFGKFQGVLKGAEKIVRISVNGSEANFHMYLDNSGEAYFVREESVEKDAESGEQVFSSSDVPDSVQDGGLDNNRNSQEIDGCNIIDRTSAQLYEFHAEDPLNGNSVSSTEYTYSYESINDVEDLVDSSQDLNSEMVLFSVDGHVLTAPISSNEVAMENVQLTTPQFHLGPGEGSAEGFASGGDEWGANLFRDLNASAPDIKKALRHSSVESSKEAQLPDHHQESQSIRSSLEENTGLRRNGNDVFSSCLEFSDLASETKKCDSPGSDSSSVPMNGRTQLEDSVHSSLSFSPLVNKSVTSDDFHTESDTKHLSASSEFSFPVASDVRTDNGEVEGSVTVDESLEHVRNHGICADMVHKVHQVCPPTPQASSDFPSGDESVAINMHIESHEECLIIENSESRSGSVSVSVKSLELNMDLNYEPMESIQEQSSTKEIPDTQGTLFGMGFEISLCGNLLRPGMGLKSANAAFEAHRISREEFESSGQSIVKNKNLIVRFKEKYLPWDVAAPLVLGKAAFGLEIPIDVKNCISPRHTHNVPSSSRRWRLWPIPFRRVRTLQRTDTSSSSEDVFLDSDSFLQSPRTDSIGSPRINGNESSRKHFIRTNIPTTKQIESLKLKDGQNTIAFSFSTRVLGKQQVDAHVYLWKWNARIVISDVDGTITKSDVLGQFMPLVGRDWTQSGVARLFSAIKENGYQLLFLSARAIVQAYLTRSFLLNIKQDGKTLPNGPVVISPDGLFPSLYREGDDYCVFYTQAPHEFKIACLEDIRALFPSDYNPFYAGFGNRDTDELSYRKLGFERKSGEVAVNHSIDVKSYTSLHTLVNDMFPPTSVAEQEDFNSWNYWKMPLPSIDC